MSLLVKRLGVLSLRRAMSSVASVDPKIGAREVVGYGMNGTLSYEDREDFPMPSIRFRPDTPDIKTLREKEKGDWKKLTIAEKKALYRASFCQTFAEFNAPTGEWKCITGWVLFASSLALWVFMFFKTFAFSPNLPVTFSEERQQAQLRRMIDLQIGAIEGLSSKYPRPE